MKPIVYLPGPVTGASHDERYLWRKYIKLRFSDKAEFLDPLDFGDWDRADAEEYNTIQFRCREAIEECHAIIAKMPKPSIGTAIGTFLGWWLGKIVIVIGKKEHFPTLEYYADQVVIDEDEAVEWLDALLPPMNLPKPPLRTERFGFNEIVNLVRLECIGYQQDPAISGLIVKEITNGLKEMISSDDDTLTWDATEEIVSSALLKRGLSDDRLRTLGETGYYDLESMRKNIADLERKLGTERDKVDHLKKENYRLKQELEKKYEASPDQPAEDSIQTPGDAIVAKGYHSIHLITNSPHSKAKLVEWVNSEKIEITEDVIEYEEFEKLGQRISSRQNLGDILLFEGGQLRHLSDIEGNLKNKYQLKFEGRTISTLIKTLEGKFTLPPEENNYNNIAQDGTK